MNKELPFPIPECILLSDTPIPEFASIDIKLESLLEQIQKETVEEICQFVCSEFGMDNIKVVIHQILYFSLKNQKKIELYAELLISIQQSLDFIIDPVEIGKKNGMLLRLLFTEGFYSREQVKKACENYTVVVNNKKTYRPLYFYFAKEFGLYEKDAHYFGLKNEYIRKLKEDNYYLWKEIIECGFELNSMQYAIIHDDEVQFEHWMAMKYALGEKLPFSSFDGLYKNSSITVSQAVAFYGAEKIFGLIKDEMTTFGAEECNWAARGGNMNILNMCLEIEGCDFTKSFAAACYSHNVEVVDFVLKNGAVVNDIEDVIASNYIYGLIFAIGRIKVIPPEALHSALVNENRVIASILLKERCDINYKTNSQKTVVHEAAELAYIEVLKHLKFSNAKFTNADIVGTIPLHLVIKSRDLECFRFVLHESMDSIDKEDDFGSPLHYAARYNFVEAAEDLIKAGANVNIAGNGGYTPLHIASKKNYSTIVRILKENKAQMDAKSTKGHTGAKLASSKYVKGLFHK